MCSNKTTEGMACFLPLLFQWHMLTLTHTPNLKNAEDTVWAIRTLGYGKLKQWKMLQGGILMYLCKLSLAFLYRSEKIPLTFKEYYIKMNCVWEFVWAVTVIPLYFRAWRLNRSCTWVLITGVLMVVITGAVSWSLCQQDDGWRLAVSPLCL